MPLKQLNHAEMEALMREYYDGCNEADREKIMGCFTPELGGFDYEGRGYEMVSPRGRSVSQ